MQVREKRCARLGFTLTSFVLQRSKENKKSKTYASAREKMWSTEFYPNLFSTHYD